MHRPKRLANRVVEQWEQNLLLKVMQRKIKCAKSTISALQGPKKSQPQAPLFQKSRACLEVSKEEWNSDSQHDNGLAETSASHFDHSSEPRVENVLKPKDKENSFISTSTFYDVQKIESQGEENISPQLGTAHHGHHEYEIGLPIGMNDFITLTARFHENFKDSDDDLLSQIWSSCKRDNSSFDDNSGLNQTRKVGASSLHPADFDSSPIPLSKMTSLQDKRIPKTQVPHRKKSTVKDSATVSEFMKKRETGWRE